MYLTYDTYVKVITAYTMIDWVEGTYYMYFESNYVLKGSETFV